MLKLNPTTGKFDLVDLNDVYVGSGGYAANLYFTTIDSAVTGYKKFSYTVEPTETELTIPATTVEVLARTYLFDGALATTSIDTGKWVASFRAKVSGTQGAYLRFEAFLYHADTTETTLFTTTSDKIINTSYQTLSKESTQPIFTCATTDRLGCRIYAYTTHPAGITIKTIVGDGNASYFTTPLALRHSQLRDKNGEADVQHLTAAEKAKVNTDYLKIDQTTPQTVENGMPIFNGGLKVNGGSPQYFINLSPVVHSPTNYYIPGDAAVVFYFSPTADVQLVFDDGNPKLPINISGMSVTQPTIYMYLITAFVDAHVTCFSNLNTADFLAFIKGLTEDPDTVIDYSETAFTYADGVYTNVTTKPVCPTSAGGTVWTDPSAITSDYIGFKVNPTTSNVDHVGNYTNNVTTSIMKTKGQFKAGNGNLIDLVTCPITSNPILDLSGGGGLQFAMTFVPEIISAGTVDTPINSSVYASGVYGTTAFEGGYATYGGTALGMWSAVQNAISGATTLQEGVAVRGGMTYSSGNNSSMYVRDMSCFQTGFTNLNNGTSTHDNIKHYEAGTIDTSKVTSCTNNYAFYSADNSAAATNSWGLYSLEPSNYAKGLSIDGIVKPLAPLQINLVTSGFARALRIVPQNNVNGYGGYIEFGTSSTANGYGPQIGGLRTGNGDGDFVIKTGGKAQKERVRVTDGGLVGIGKTPTTILDILKSSEANLTTGLRLQNNFSTTNTAIGIDFTLSNADVILARIHAIRTNINNSARTDLVFSTYNSTLGEAMRLTGAGNLGIGMTPVEKLDVNGNVKATGYKSSDGSEGQTTTVTVVTDTRMNSGQLQKKTQVLTYKNGLLTDKAAESDWTDTTDV